MLADNPKSLSRRAAIKKAAALVGGALTVTQLGQLTESLAAVAEDAPSRFLDPQQFAMLSRICDLIIPETDTPGALGVGVPHFIDMMLADWASPERQTRWVEGLADIDSRAGAAGMDNFSAGSAAQQTELLTALDKAFFAQGYVPTFFSSLKQMVLFAYYASEVGATVELRFQRVPVDYLPCVPVADDDRAWFWSQYNYGL